MVGRGKGRLRRTLLTRISFLHCIMFGCFLLFFFAFVEPALYLITRASWLLQQILNRRGQSGSLRWHAARAEHKHGKGRLEQRRGAERYHGIFVDWASTV